MRVKYTRKSERNTGRIGGYYPASGGNPPAVTRAQRRERPARRGNKTPSVDASMKTKAAYIIRRALKSLIAAGRYCPPGRHFGKYTRPVVRKGDR